MEEYKVQGPLFNGKNYANWKYRMEIQLTAAKGELIRFVNIGLETLLIPESEQPGDSAQVKKRKEEERKELRRLDAVCKDVLVRHIDEDQIEIIKDLKTSYQIWQTLSERFIKGSVTTRMHLAKQYALLKYAPKEEKFENFCLKFDKLVRELKLAGAKYEELDEVLQFMAALPAEYKSLVTALKTMDSSRLTMSFVRSNIEDFEMDQEGKKTNSYKAPSVAFLTRGGARYSPYQNKFGYACHNCGNIGHRKKECWCPGGGAFRGRGRGNNQNHGERDQQTTSRGRGGNQNQDGGRGGHSSYSLYNNFVSTNGFRGGRGGRGFGGRSRGWQYRGGRGGSQGNHQTAQLTQSTTTTNQSTSLSTNPKTEMANLSKLDDDIVYSFMSEQVPKLITIDSCHNALNINSSDSTSVTSYDGIAIEFILDSGASKHLVREDVPVQYKKWLSEPVLIQVAKEKIILKAYWKGFLRCKTFVNGETHQLDIEVLITENLSHNLLSISSLEKLTYKITFWDGKCFVELDKILVALGHRLPSNLYRMIMYVDVESANNSVSMSSEADLWHRRLGHPGKSYLKQVCKMVDGVGNIGDGNGLCEICVEGKQVKLPFHGTRERATRPLERVHSDLCGPIAPTAYNGVRYFLTFLDDFTHFAVVYGLKEKSEVFEYFKLYEARVTNRFPDKKIFNFRCDNGGEFVNRNMRQLFAEKGIEYEPTIPNTPENNGVAERLNRTLLEKARCMLLGSSLRKSFWIESLLTAVYLLNRSPTRALDGDKVPAELWYGVRPNLQKLRVFGCNAYVCKSKEQCAGKFDSRSKKCFLLGYVENGYRLWSIEDKRVITARNVVFDETKNTFNKNYIVNDAVNDMNENDDVSDDVNDDDTELPEMEEFDEVSADTGLRRSTRVRIQPRHLQDYVTLASIASLVSELSESGEADDSICYDRVEPSVMDLCNDVPVLFDDIQYRKDKNKWMKAVNEELQALKENETWELVSLPSHKKPINCKWVFTVKVDAAGEVERYKARVVAKGCAQRAGIDYNETYAPVARITTVRVFLSLVNKNNLYVHQLDVKCAFLNGDLEEEIFMWPPQGLDVDGDIVCKLKKSLYGLKQAPKEWNKKFNECVKSFGFDQCLADRCIYVRKKDGDVVYLLLYVDDFLIASNNEELLHTIKNNLMLRFKMRDLGEALYFLGIKITRSTHGLFLSQENYVKKIVQRFKMDTSSSVKTPLEPSPNLDLSGAIIVKEKPYRELIGSLMYATMFTRPDICVAVNLFSQFQTNATEIQWKGLKRILRYLQGTPKLGIWFKGNSHHPLVLYVDADFANNPGRKSISGFVIEMFGDPVLWATRKQNSVALSSTEAEFVSLATGVAELLWLKQLLKDLGVSVTEPIPVFEDNQPCIHALESWETKRLKHVDVKYNFVKDLHRSKVINVKYIPTGEQKADIFTKGLPVELFNKHRINIGMCEMSS
ncbi:Copia protein [Frankliniella fusca]|uniref:Copia protein n=1 Tax=Frankliniella fusca TaxID=407009 RepID=A0AAE1GQF0_9NEOP|nr:Copia protein [Frankliniella fusca]KAK3931422.1 Copia protein [Frankliniella fusca]